MLIETNFMRALISKIIERAIRKKTGNSVGIDLKEFRVKFDGSKAKAHICIDAEINKEDILSLTKSITQVTESNVILLW